VVPVELVRILEIVVESAVRRALFLCWSPELEGLCIFEELDGSGITEEFGYPEELVGLYRFTGEWIRRILADVDCCDDDPLGPDSADASLTQYCLKLLEDACEEVISLLKLVFVALLVLASAGWVRIGNGSTGLVSMRCPRDPTVSGSEEDSKPRAENAPGP
jgi:hypothetical protein